MLNRNSKLRKVARSGLRRRPSAAMMVAMTALFVALSGGAYAAVSLPARSVGAAQLKTFAVTNPKLGTDSVGPRKIMPGAVGFYRVNRNEVQLRVNGTCSTGQAMTAVTVGGGVTCAGTGPSESNSGAATTKTLSTTSTSLAGYQLPGGSAYLVQATPYITLNNTSGSAHATVACTLAAGTATSSTTTQSVSVSAGPGETSYASLPLTVIAGSSANAQTANLTCQYSTSDVTAPTVTAQATIYALGVNPASTS